MSMEFLLNEDACSKLQSAYFCLHWCQDCIKSYSFSIDMLNLFIEINVSEEAMIGEEDRKRG